MVDFSQIVVTKSILDTSLVSLLGEEPTMLPAWDPMGSLACVGREPSGLSLAAGEGREALAGYALSRCRI